MKTMIVSVIKGLILTFWYFVRYDRFQKFDMLVASGYNQNEAFDLVYNGMV